MLNLNKTAEKWFKCGDDVELRLTYIDDDERVKIVQELNIDLDNPQDDKLEIYYLRMLDKAISGWRGVIIVGTKPATCNSRNKGILLKNHRGLAIWAIIEALKWWNFSPDREEVLGKSERSSNIGSTGNGAEDSPLTVASA